MESLKEKNSSTRVCIFGADGRTGVELVKKTIDSGYNVVAFVYDKENCNQFDESVKIIQGNILDYENVEQVVLDVDVVISVIGHIKNSDPLMQTKGIGNVINAMKKHGVKRLISLTGTGARISGDRPSLIDQFLNFIINIIDPERITDGKEHVKVIQGSGLDWTILRVLKLTTKKTSSNYRLTEYGPAELFTSRIKVAKIIIDLIDSKEFIHKMPIPS